MSAARKPVPTDYNGVRFRSKSEAVFARCLDLKAEVCLAGTLAWSYEQEAGGVVPNGAAADFTVVVRGRKGMRLQFIQIEYKPSEPSAAYIEQWAERMEPVSDRKDSVAILVFGSSWSGEYKHLIALQGSDHRVKVIDGWVWGLEKLAPKAARYRFDLAKPDG